ncbi:oligopeptide/dipeptide ABC transporter ATP-binding protein [Psittacicella gerlachiana]|uniref:ABC transporter domain-containing protein n=1 Tax=Psittacicella gerlachiana TaxID=2028574 RepID=A0A3A1YCT7_9GAMM|nr:oligopeptide/dipeptide ABC transporter ATP-binding protein [Psittacicella gerlachiana]RIY35485.1 hypothetical protein CKF59_03565 [Psittacicella gerlachiana]
MALLEISNLTVTIRDPNSELDVPLIDNFSISIQAGEFVGLIGETGSGKSVIARILGGYIRPHWKIQCSSFRLNGQELLIDTCTLDTKLLSEVVGVIDQDPANVIDPSQKILPQLLARMDLCQRWRGLIWRKRQKQLKEIIDLFTRMGIKEPEPIFNAYYQDLSQTEQHLMAIAMTVVTEPLVLIADEPTTGLNSISTQRVQALFKRLNANFNKTVLYLSNNYLTVKSLTHSAHILYFGQVVERFFHLKEMNQKLLNYAHHPYTRLFLQSLPDFTSSKLIYKTQLYAIPGQLPELSNVPIGCRFGPRCEFAQKKCMQVPSLVRDRENGFNEFACHFPVDVIEAETLEQIKEDRERLKREIVLKIQEDK